MANGISLHIGINEYDQTHYEGLSDLFACENDATAMYDIAQRKGYESHILHSQAATSHEVRRRILLAAETLSAGGIFWISFAGHGGQVADWDYDEIDFQDETWCLYDRQLIDDELLDLWHQFKEGIRILVVSDSCHSGTVARAASSSPFLLNARANGGADSSRSTNTRTSVFLEGFEERRYRNMPQSIAAKVSQKNKVLYQNISQNTSGATRADCKASIKLLAACQDHQRALDGVQNGFFTSHLLRLLNSEGADLSYTEFHARLSEQMPDTQQPNYDHFGEFVESFETQSVFVVESTPNLAAVGHRGVTSKPVAELFNLPALEAGGISWENARSLALASQLAYENPQAVRNKLEAWGFSEQLIVDEPGFDVQGFLAASDKVVITSFRGTKGALDWVVNFDIFKTKLDYGSVHGGFFDAFKSVESQIDQFLLKQTQDNASGSLKKLFVCGHSLGGALALLMATEMRFHAKPFANNFEGLATFGQPRVGNKVFKQNVMQMFGNRYARYVNKGDIVPRIPPGYQHAVLPVLFDRDGNLIVRSRSENGLSQQEEDVLNETQYELLRTKLTRGMAIDGGAIGMRGQIIGLHQHAISRYIANLHKVITG